MDFNGRATRRPMPRQMDVSDWPIDADVRNGVSSSLGAYQRNCPTLEVRTPAATLSRRLPSGEARRNDVQSLLRPINRYDSVGASSRTREEVSAFTPSAWRVGDEALRTAAPRQTRLPERVLEVEPSSHRPQPRSIPARHTEERHRMSHSYRGMAAMDMRSRISERVPASQSIETPNTSIIIEDDTSDFDHTPFSPVEGSPPREQTRYASPASTVRSDASTLLTSSPFTPSITDTPTSIVRSIRTPPYTPSSNDTSSLHTSPESTPPSVNCRSTQASTRSATADSGTLSGDVDSSYASLSATDNSPSSSPLLPRAAVMTPRQQREQLYDFRRDMRHVLTRVDEMVDLHRDMFKGDVVCGLPVFDSTLARETASFATETFNQLTNLRQRFEEMTTAWERASLNLNPSISARQVRDDDSTVNVLPLSSRLQHSVDSDGSVEESSVSSDSPIASSQQSSDISHHASLPRSRWEPTLSTLSNNDESSSSTSISDAGSSSLPSELPTISRPSTASSSVITTRSTVFEDFDRRMEEIRASLSAIARSTPSSQTLPPRSAISTTSTNKSRYSSEQEQDDDTGDESRENNPRVGNRAPWRQPQDDSPANTRHDREARLRQLLRELQTTGEHLDAASTPRAR